MKKIAVLVGLVLIVSCNKKTETKVEEASNQTSQPVISITNELTQPKDSTTQAEGNLPVMTFAETDYNFGEIEEGDVVTHDFQFTNTGTVPLIISNAVGSCGCTIPEYPKEPIAPGEKGVIKVKFNSKGFEGEKNKEVFVETNTAQKREIIKFKATVNKK